MTVSRGDIDIDVSDREVVLSGVRHVAATIITDGKISSHNVGIYVQHIPAYPMNNRATLDYRVAEKFGYQKVDILNNSIYDHVKSEEHLESLLGVEPAWNLLCHEEVVKQLSHINGYAPLLKRLRPQSIEDLAMILAIIRPAKSHLRNSSWDDIRASVWDKCDGDEGYVFKRAHSISYAVSIIVQMNLLVEEAYGKIS